MNRAAASKFTFRNPLLLSDFAHQLGMDPGSIIKHFFINGRITGPNTVLSLEDCRGLCQKWNVEFEEGKEGDGIVDPFEEYLSFLDVEDPGSMITRAPIVTIMGHVDHGKTTLLDNIRGTSVAQSEFGGITQHIGAYQVTKNGRKITFIDTPGHQAFSKLRSRGANVTDIVVIVVAADDGIKPQTIEAIHHALSANVRIIVFANKMDKGIKKLTPLKNSLMEHRLVLEEFGGDVLWVQGSALTGDGIPELLETIVLVADMEELKTVESGPAVGTIIESKQEKGLGFTATVLLTRGTVKCGDQLTMRGASCRVKSMVDSLGNNLKALEPSCPARISGFKGIPEAGDRFISFGGLSEEKSQQFLERLKEMEARKSMVALEKSSEISNLNFLVKGDVSGSLEAIKEIAHAHGIPVGYANIGTVTDSDLQLASISNAMVINFNQKIPGDILTRAKEMRLILKDYHSVYEMEEEMEKIIEANRIVEYVEETLGQAQVLKLWRHSKVGTIAGCKVISGRIEKTNRIRLLRESEVLVSSSIKSFKTESYEIKECSEGQECGIVIEGWNEVKVGDIIEAYRMVEKQE